MHQCTICKRNFTSDRLLSIHISELHDSYFRALAAKKASYVCLIEDCKDVFRSNRERRDHLIKHHLFPKSFDFHQPKKYSSIAKHKSSEKILEQTKTCKFYGSKGGCWYGSSCRFAHQEKLEIIDENVMDSNGTGCLEEAGVSAAGCTSEGSNNDKDKRIEMDVDDICMSLSQTRIVSPHVSFGRVGRKGRLR